MTLADKIFATIKSAAKIVLHSRRPGNYYGRVSGGRIYVLANGPSLAEVLADHLEYLKTAPTMAVNFAALASDFAALRPRYYVLADPHFFADRPGDSNLKQLRECLRRVDWPMMLFVPVPFLSTAKVLYGSAFTEITGFNAVGVESFGSLQRLAYRHGAGMPRPRNVLIPSLMLAVALGYQEVVILGADHSWTKTLSVTDDNDVVSVQPHFYADSSDEQSRIRHEYRNYRLHQIMESFAVAFKSYHDIADYARHAGVKIINATPGSFIDAFERRPLSELI